MQENGNGFLSIPISKIVFREDLYPRIKHDPVVVQRYAENLEILPPIEINQHNILIDGYHRWTAHRSKEASKIKATVTQTVSEAELYSLSIKRNANHGLQMSEPDKQKAAIRLYASGTGLDKDQIAETLSVSRRMVNTYLQEEDRKLREERKQKIFDMWLACATQDEIAGAVGIPQQTIADEIKVLPNLEAFPKSVKVLGAFQDATFETPVYNVWAFGKKSNEVSHFGNSEQRILDNLLYLYTQPFDVVIDPFAGGGSTIDVCKKRMRRYWASDRKPIVERENEIRVLDVVQELPPLNKRWSEVSLTYLDPPYWKQAAGKYSKDKEDLANMPLGEFTDAIADLVSRLASKQSHGAIALLIQPTQWNAEGREFTDHVSDILQRVKTKRLTLENRVSCPYSTEQCTPQMVEWAKKNKKLLVISRELIIWRFVS